MVLVVSMVLTLFGRLYYVQLLDPNKPSQTRRTGCTRAPSSCPRRVA